MNGDVACLGIGLKWVFERDFSNFDRRRIVLVCATRYTAFVLNPPCSLQFTNSEDRTLISKKCWAAVRVLTPKSKAESVLVL